MVFKDIASSLISTMNGNVFLANLTMDAMRDQRKNMFKNTYIERFSICGNIYIGILGKSFVQYDFRTTFISLYGPERFGKLSI